MDNNKIKWVLTQAIEWYEKGESLHWATQARELLAELDGAVILKSSACGCVVARSPNGLYYILGQTEGVRKNPLAGKYSDKIMIGLVMETFCPHDPNQAEGQQG